MNLTEMRTMVRRDLKDDEADNYRWTDDELNRHIARAVINPADARPAIVTRKFMGQSFDVNCLATQNLVNLWQSGQLAVGDYVIVSFIDEIPNTVERHIAIVTDKVYESW